MIWLVIPALLAGTAGLGESRRKEIVGYCLAFVLLVGCVLQSACGGGSTAGGKGVSTATSTGTYQIVVTGTSNAMTQTTAITMTVR